eukprot:3600901-Rhodomonas_salina.1
MHQHGNAVPVIASSFEFWSAWAADPSNESSRRYRGFEILIQRGGVGPKLSPNAVANWLWESRALADLVRVSGLDPSRSLLEPLSFWLLYRPRIARCYRALIAARTNARSASKSLSWNPLALYVWLSSRSAPTSTCTLIACAANAPGHCNALRISTGQRIAYAYQHQYRAAQVAPRSSLAHISTGHQDEHAFLRPVYAGSVPCALSAGCATSVPHKDVSIWGEAQRLCQLRALQTMPANAAGDPGGVIPGLTNSPLWICMLSSSRNCSITWVQVVEGCARTDVRASHRRAKRVGDRNDAAILRNQIQKTTFLVQIARRLRSPAFDFAAYLVKSFEAGGCALLLSEERQHLLACAEEWRGCSRAMAQVSPGHRIGVSSRLSVTLQSA